MKNNIIKSKKGFSYGDVPADIVAIIALVFIFSFFTLIFSFHSVEEPLRHKIVDEVNYFDTQVQTVQFLNSPVDIKGYKTNFARAIQMGVYDDEIHQIVVRKIEEYLIKLEENSGMFGGVSATLEVDGNQKIVIILVPIHYPGQPTSNFCRTQFILYSDNELAAVEKPNVILPGFVEGHKVLIKTVFVSKEMYKMNTGKMEVVDMHYSDIVERCYDDKLMISPESDSTTNTQSDDSS